MKEISSEGQADKVYILGVGADGSLPPGGARFVEEADILFGGERLLALFPEAGGEKIIVKRNLSEVEERIRENLGRKKLVVLASGDPNFFGIAGYLVKKLGKEHIEIIPNISSVQLAFARIKESWEDAAFVSVHGREPEEILEALSRSRKIAVLTDERWNPGAVAKFLLERGVIGVRAYLCENLGTEGERVAEMSLSELSLMEKFAPLSLLLLLREREQERAFGIPEEELAHRRGLITKQEIRAIALSKLRLSERSILWDIGAGSGSLSIEASFLARKGRIFAVEREPEQIRLLKENVRRFEAWNVEVIRAEAPEGLDGLPDPDAVFIGGSGGRIGEILDVVCRRLKRGGRIVANAATLESMNAAAEGLKRRGFEVEIALVNVARSKAVANLTRLQSLNPVFVITGSREKAE